MRIKNNFVLQQVADEFLVVPIAEEADRIHGVVRLNETGAFLWKCLIKGVESKTELEESMMSEYKADGSTIQLDVEGFLEQLNAIGCLE